MVAVQHMAFGCKNIKVSEKFFSKHFGFKRVRTFNKGTPGEFIMLRCSNACLELFQAGEKEKALSGGEQPVGFKHLAFEVESIERTVAGLKADGIKTDDIIDCSSIVPGMRVCFFNDPDGNRLEVMQGYKDE